MNKIFVYTVFLILCGFVHAEIIDIKIDFARVQDIKGDNPSHTAACIIAWVVDDTEEKVFCRYQLGKTRKFLRDNDVLNRILDNSGKLRNATFQNFRIKIKDWLDNIEKGLQGKELLPIHQQKISKLFAEFVTTDVKEYVYPKNDILLKFKNSKPYNLVLSNKLDDSDVAFAILVHSEIHNAISAKSNTNSNTDKHFILTYDSTVLEIVAMVLVVCSGLLLYLLVVILLHSRKSQKRMDGIAEKLKNELDNSVTNVSQKVTLDTQSKQEILNAISAQNAKVKQEHELLELRNYKVEKELIQQHLTMTKEELVKVQNQYKNMINSLSSLMIKRFGVTKPEFLPQLSEQKGTWRWLQSVLIAQYNNYHNAFSNVKSLNDSECDKILKLLNIESILKYWYKFVTENPHFESDKKLLECFQTQNIWLHNIFRADDLLKTYFLDKTQLNSLITPLAIAAILLQAALKELGVEVIKPNLFASPPANLASNARKKATNPLLMELLHKKVMTKLSDTVPQLVVDVEKYGFVTSQGNSKTAMKVLVADLGGWEFYKI